MATEVESPQVEQVEVVKPEEEVKPDGNHVEENKPEGGEEANEKPKEPEAEAGEGEAKKEENGTAPPKLKLHQPPPGPNVPNFLPSCLCVETYLRMNKIPYENVYATKLTANKVKMPYIEYQGDKVQDAKFCIKFINKKFEVDPDSHLTPEQKAVCHAFQTMVDENTYWSLVYYRWVDNYNETKKYYENMAPIMSSLRPKLDQNKCIKCMEAHGIGKHSKEEIYCIAEDDLRSISHFLGDKEFFMGEHPCTIDCSMFGILANFVYGAAGCPQEKLIREELKNLGDFCDRMKLNYWLDYGDICSEEYVEGFKPKSRFSMKKKKKTKTSEAKEGEASAEQKDGEEEKNGEEAGKKEDEEETKPEEGAKAEGEAVTEEEAKPEEEEKKDEESPSEPAEEVAAAEASPSEEKTEEKPAEE